MQNEKSGESGSAGAKLSSVEPCDSDEEETSGMTHYAGEKDTVAHQSVDEEEDRNNSSSSLLMKTTTIKSEEVYHDEHDTVAHQSFKKVVDVDDSNSSFLFNTFSN